MIVPSIHLNGTSRDDLVRQCVQATTALQTALQKLEMATPHPRDYYVQNDPNAGKTARAEHRRRCELVKSVLDEMQALGEAIVTAPGRA